MRATSRWVLGAGLVACALLTAAPDATAGPRSRSRKAQVDTVSMARPSGGPDEDASGTLTVTHRARGDALTLRVRGLERRRRYQVVDGTSGEVLGAMRTNGRGRGSFALSQGRRTARRGLAATADGMPDCVEIIDPRTGETVLVGDVTGETTALYGWASLGNATESVTISMGSEPYLGSQYFSFTYSAPPTDDGWYAPVHEVWIDTANGDELPLGAGSVADLAGLRFQVRDADGQVVFRGALPDVEAYTVDVPPMKEPPVWEGGWEDDPNGVPVDWTGWEEWTGDVPFDFENWADLGDGFDWTMLEGFFGGCPGPDGTTEPGTTDRPVVDGPLPPEDAPVVYTLWLETEDGFVHAADLRELTYWVEPLPCEDWMWTDPAGVPGDGWMMDGDSEWTFVDDTGGMCDPSGGTDANGTTTDMRTMGMRR